MTLCGYRLALFSLAQELGYPWPSGWRPIRGPMRRLERVLSDNGSEFRSGVFGDMIRHRERVLTFIRAGRPAINGAGERAYRTILEECWRPSFARSLVPALTGLIRDLAADLRFYSEERANTGRLTAGRAPLAP